MITSILRLTDSLTDFAEKFRGNDPLVQTGPGRQITARSRRGIGQRGQN